MGFRAASRRPRMPSGVGDFVMLLAVALVAATGCGDSRNARQAPSTGDDLASQAAAPREDRSDAKAAEGGIRFVPLAKRVGDGPTLFTELTSRDSGVDFVNALEPRHVDRRLYHSGFACGGVAVGDVNGDGQADLFLTSGPRPNRLYLQTSNFHFEDAAALAGLEEPERWSVGAAMVDVDNDGDLDVYVCNYDAANQLYVNDGRGRFREAAAEFGLDLVDASLMPAFCDYDADGDLDLYLLTNRFYRRGGRPEKPPIDLRTNPPQILPEFRKYYGFKKIGPDHYGVDVVGRPDRLLRQESDGTFHDVTDQTGIYGSGHGLSATWWDYNGDGWSDLYVANDFNDADRLYRNNGDGTFDDVLVEDVPYTSWFSMGSDFADVDGDGRFDLLVADMSPRTHFGRMTTTAVMNQKEIRDVVGPPQQTMRNTFFLNTGTGRFLEAAELAGLADTDWTWTVMLDDFDNDGRVDLLVTNGVSRSYNNSDVPLTPEMLVGKTEWDLHERRPARPEMNLAFRGAGDLRFDEVSRVWGFDKLGMSYAAARGDLDRDGDLDVVVANLDAEVSIYRNNSSAGNSLQIRLRGAGSNRFGVGAVAEVTCAGRTKVDQLSPYTGYLSSSEPIIHIGLGEAKLVDQILIRWPSGVRQQFANIPANVLVEISEPSVTPNPPPEVADHGSRDESSWFLPSDRFGSVRHVESPFNDFQMQPLLPRKLSQLGPGLAVADVDSDGDDDVFVGGSAGNPGKLLISQGQGLRVANVPTFESDRDCEDLGAVWLDADADDDLDLYVVSGSVEFGTETELLEDRLYLNDGQARFERAPSGALPNLRDSGSCAVAGDFDRDGDLDLFVGSRVVPGRYPLSPTSRLLRNEGGRFSDATDEVAAELKQCGMVTGGLWSDIDGDGWLDLLVTTEWGPIRLFHNNAGTLHDATASAGLAAHTGWWNGIVGRDLDGDGDIDYVATNFGENTRYHAAPDKPLVLFYGDFQETGKMSLVEAEYEGDKLFPTRDKFAIAAAMPLVGDRYSTHRQYGAADLNEILIPELLDAADRFEVRTLESSVLTNDGSGKFTLRPLPRLAQLAPAFGAELGDWNADGHADLYVVGNFAAPRVSAGPMNGGVSLLLAGAGDGRFTPVPPHSSGLVVPGDAKSLASGDFDGDGRSELVVGVNNDQLLGFLPNTPNEGQAGSRLRVTLVGHRGNRQAIGATVTAHTDNGRQQSVEVYAGHGYLSQSSSIPNVACPPGSRFTRVDVRWPDGYETQHALDGQLEITIDQPE